LQKELHRLVFRQIPLLLQIVAEVPLVAVFQNQVEVISSFLQVVEFYYVLVVTGAQDFNFVLEEFVEFTLD
jgi:hypothetical protein